MFILDETIKATHSVDAAIPNSHNLHSTITWRLQKNTDLKEDLMRIWQLKTTCIILLGPSKTRIISNKLHESLNLLNLHPALCIPMQKAAINNYVLYSEKGLDRAVNKECLVSEIGTFLETS